MRVGQSTANNTEMCARLLRLRAAGSPRAVPPRGSVKIPLGSAKLSPRPRRQAHVRKIAKPGHRHRAVGWYLFGFDAVAFDDATPDLCSFAMPSIEKSPDLLVVLGLWPKNGVDFVKKDGGPPLRVRNLPEKISRCDVDGFDGARNKQHVS